MSKPVCLVTGVGPAKGTGAEVAKRFAEGGYQVAMLARNKDNLSDCEKGAIDQALASGKPAIIDVKTDISGIAAPAQPNAYGNDPRCL